ncbi:MAG: hypothetical protein KDA22_07005 [Phycisphaerales bacterium]|nr:hypothetical protein [Phycisphaerales bacterium]
MTHESSLRLRSLPFGARLGMTLLLLVLLGGLAAASAHLVLHHENRDEEPGLSRLDITGAYHGVLVPSPLLGALERGHPEELAPSARDALLAWLRGNRVDRDYDNLDLGDLAPSELLAANCLQCHSPSADAAVASPPMLQNWQEVKRVAFTKEISPTPLPILVNSTHAHALTLGAIGLLLVLLMGLTRWRRWLVGLVAFGLGAGLLCDIGGWWLARPYESAVMLIVAGGAAFSASVVLATLLILGELWLPSFSSENP